jgi:lipase
MRQVLALHPSLAHGGAFAGLELPDWQITAPDMIGHGKAADWDGQGDLHSLCTRDSIDVATALAQTGPIDIIGHSFGATIALRIALERPELLRSIVLIEPVLFAAARADEMPEYKSYLRDHMAFDALLRQGQFDVAAHRFQSVWGDGRDFSQAPKSVQNYIIKRIPLIAAQSQALHNDTAGIMGYLRLEALGLPVLLIQGSDSPPIIGAIARSLAARLPNLRQMTIQGAQHMLPITHPKPTSQAILQFWHSLPKDCV